MDDNNKTDELVLTEQQIALSTVTKKLIDDHLFHRVFMLLSLFTLVGALGVYGYVSNLKSSVIEDITLSIKSDISELRSQTFINIADARRDVKEAQEIASEIKVRAEKADENLVKAEQFSEAAKESAEKISEFILKNPEFKEDISSAVAKISFEDKSLSVGEDLSVTNNIWGNKTVVQGYGSGSHIWKPKSANCPDGMFVAGINVIYRGSCRSQCDADGGIIGDIELICKTL